MSVVSTCLITDLFRILLYDVLCAILILKSGFEDFIIKQKFMILITDIRTDLSQINPDVHEYNLDLDAPLPSASNSAMSLLSNTTLPNTYVCTIYINVAAKTKATSKKTTKEKKKIILQNRAKDIVELLRDAKFAP